MIIIVVHFYDAVTGFISAENQLSLGARKTVFLRNNLTMDLGIGCCRNLPPW